MVKDMPRVYGFSVYEEDAEEVERSLRFLESILRTKSRSKAIAESVKRIAVLIQRLCIAKRDKFAEFQEEYSILCKEVDELRKML
jgi:uncharacterized protein Yka (UPF0111/DUF47 family)